MATTEVKRFWTAPRSARVLLIELNALSTICRACCAPAKVLTSRFAAVFCVAAVAMFTVPLAARPAWVMAVAPSFHESNFRLPVASAVAVTPVSPDFLLIAAASALPRATLPAAAAAVSAAPAFAPLKVAPLAARSTLSMATPLIWIPVIDTAL
ncbi:hypothetical protein D3C71_1584380 [compost metagenome]